MAAPVVDHSFNGESRLLTATQDRRTEVRQALTALQQELQRIEGHPVQIQADIRFNVAGSRAKEHLYTVSVTDPKFDPDLFARTKLPVKPAFTDRVAPTSQGNHATDSKPHKRTRTGDEIREDALTDVALRRMTEMTKLMEDWRNEWVQQGGWLFDKLNAIEKAQRESRPQLETKLGEVQDVLGQSINSSCATQMSELSKIIKLIPWLEVVHCRKSNADKVQAREEKWRSSSATFHDQSRRDREKTEQRLEARLESQRQLLIQLAEVNGIDVGEDEKEVKHDKDEGGVQASLGDQLTAELTQEAQRAAQSRNNSLDPITID